MTPSSRHRVLFCSTETRQKKQRGIYFYIKSLIAALESAGYPAGLLTEAQDHTHHSLLSSRIYNTLFDPEEFTPGRLRMLGRYLQHRGLGRLHGRTVPNDRSMLTEEHLWFLRHFEAFVNVPRIYDTLELATRLPMAPPLDLSFAADHGYNMVMTTAPTHVRAKSAKVKLVQTVHDLIPLQVTLESNRADTFFRAIQSTVRHADLMIAISQYTRDQLVQLFPEAAGRVKVIYQAIPADQKLIELSRQPLVQEAVLDKFGLKADQYAFYIGAIEPRKNIHRLITAHHVVAKQTDCPLILAGPVNKKYAAEQGLKDILVPGRRSTDHREARYIGYVTEIEKLCLLRNARFFGFPTLNEGFGIPVLEAQTLGCPVLTSRVSSIPEVVGDSAAMIEDPYNLDEMASTMQRLITDDAYRQQLRQAGLANAARFSQESFAAQLNEALSSV